MGIRFDDGIFQNFPDFIDDEENEQEFENPNTEHIPDMENEGEKKEKEKED